MNEDKTAPELKIIGNVMPLGHNVGNIYDPDGISPTIMLNHGYPALILEEATDNDMNQLIQVAQIYDKEKNPTNGRVYSPNSISPTLTTPTGGNSMPLILAMEQIPFNTADEGLAYTITTRYGAMCASNLIDGNFPMTGILTIENPTEEMKRQMILEGEDPSIISLMSWNRPGGDVGDVSPAITTSAWEQNNFVKLPDGDSPMVMADPRKNYGRLQPSAESSPTLLSTDYKSPHLVVERGDGELDMSDPETRIIKRAADHVAQEYGTQTRFRIRKLTPRECYRLMDVPEEYIDRLLASGISKSQHYKLAGNSIVVSCLYHIFKNLFTNEIPVNQQLSLF